MFTKPRLEILTEDLEGKVVETMERITRTMDTFVHRGRSICGVTLSCSLMERVICFLIEHQEHLLLDVGPRGVYFLEQATQDLESFLEKNPLYAPQRK